MSRTFAPTSAGAAAGSFDRRAIPGDAAETLWTAPDGHLIRRIDWPAPAGKERGSMLFLPGRGDAYEKYIETFEHWRGQGWRVTATDWRGQAGSGRLGADSFTGHIADFAHWVADLASFWREWARGRTGPLVLVGHSMGGHLALRAVAESVLEPAPAALVMTAPMLDMGPERIPLLVRYGAARAMNLLGDPRRPAWKWTDRPGEVPPSRRALLTHCEARYADELWWRQERPDLAMGPGSWGWVAGAIASARTLERSGMLESVDLPVYIVATVADRLVGVRAIRRAALRFPRAQELWFGPEAAHEILREVDPVRDRALIGIDRFLGRLPQP